MIKRVVVIGVASILGLGVLAGCSNGAGELSNMSEEQVSGEVQSEDPSDIETVEVSATIENMTGTWKLKAGRSPESEINPEGQKWLELIVEPDGSFSGSGGCNGMMGKLTVEAGKVSFGPIGSTKMACEEPILLNEHNYFTALEAVTEGEVANGMLILTGEDTELVFKPASEDSQS